jgi:hypothetical protein
MRSTTRRRLALFTAALVVATASAALSAPSAAAAPVLPIDWTVYASTHLAKPGLDVTVPPGAFTGSADLGTGDLSGNLSLPPASISLQLLGAVPAATAQFAIHQVGPVTGHVDLSTLHATATAVFAIDVVTLTPSLPTLTAGNGALESVNLVGDDCTTRTPITVTMEGAVDLVHGSTFSSTFAVPPFTHCKLLTPVLNALIPGDGNTFTATFVPNGSPPPPAPVPPPPEPPLAIRAQADVKLGPVDLPIGPVTTPPIEIPDQDTNLLGWLLTGRR